MDNAQWQTYVQSALGVGAQTTTIDRVHGGYMNSTIRLSVDDSATALPLPTSTRFALRSAILKHYPPYMYAWPDAALDSRRSRAEYDALSLFHVDGRFRKLSEEVGIVIPRPIWYDESHNVLWMEDMGHCVDLQTALSAFSIDDLRLYGQRIGHFLAAFQLFTTMPALTLQSRTYEEPPASPLALPEHEARMTQAFKESAVSREEDVDHLLSALNLGESAIIGVPHKDLQRAATCFGLGDIWPSSFLILPDTSSGSIPFQGTNNPRLALIDWEFLAPTHPGTELASLAARFCTIQVGSSGSLARRDDQLGPASVMAGDMVDAYLDWIKDSSIETMMPTQLWHRRATSAWARALMNVAVGRAGIDESNKGHLIDEAIACLTDRGSPGTASRHPVLVRCLGPQ